ncbi:ClpXP protease specificity-enhancing factor [compost metagenome]
MVPVGRVIAIYARETGEGMAFPLSTEASERNAAGDAPPALSSVPTDGETEAPVMQLVPSDDDAPQPPPRTPTPGAARPALKRVK